jgi:DNA-binding transcriptional regulator YiaG
MRDPKMTTKQFRACLEKAGLSQRKFALWAGIDVGTVNRWATGSFPVPQIAAILVTLVANFPEIAEFVREQRMP